MRLPAFPSLYLVSLFARIFAGIRLHGCDTRKAMEKHDGTRLFCNGDARPRGAARNDQAKLRSMPRAQNAAFDGGRPRYELPCGKGGIRKQLEDFLEGCLKQID